MQLICLQHVHRDAARRAGLSATADPCLITFCYCVRVNQDFVSAHSLFGMFQQPSDRWQPATVRGRTPLLNSPATVKTQPSPKLPFRFDR